MPTGDVVLVAGGRLLRRGVAAGLRRRHADVGQGGAAGSGVLHEQVDRIGQQPHGQHQADHQQSDGPAPLLVLARRLEGGQFGPTAAARPVGGRGRRLDRLRLGHPSLLSDCARFTVRTVHARAPAGSNARARGFYPERLHPTLHGRRVRRSRQHRSEQRGFAPGPPRAGHHRVHQLLAPPARRTARTRPTGPWRRRPPRAPPPGSRGRTCPRPVGGRDRRRDPASSPSRTSPSPRTTATGRPASFSLTRSARRRQLVGQAGAVTSELVAVARRDVPA